MLSTPRQRQVALTLVLGFAVIGATAWMLTPKTVKIDPSNVQYLYCKNCKMEFPFLKQKDDISDPCPRCDGKRIAMKDSIKKIGSLPNPYTKMATYCFVEFIVLLAALWFVAQPRETVEDEHIYTHCPHCNQKIRYLEKQIGKPGICRRCKKTFEFPEIDSMAAAR